MRFAENVRCSCNNNNQNWKILSIKSYELDFGFQYSIAYFYNLLIWTAVHY